MLSTASTRDQRRQLIRLRYRVLTSSLWHPPDLDTNYYEEDSLPHLETVTITSTSFSVDADRELFATDEHRGPYGPRE